MSKDQWTSEEEGRWLSIHKHIFIGGGVNGYSPVARSFVARILLVAAYGSNEEERGTRTEDTFPFGHRAVDVEGWIRAGKGAFLVTANVRMPCKSEG
jgi:hypothetical protein